MIVDSKRNKYLTTWEAAEKSGYTADYIAMLC